MDDLTELESLVSDKYDFGEFDSEPDDLGAYDLVIFARYHKQRHLINSLLKSLILAVNKASELEYKTDMLMHTYTPSNDSRFNTAVDDLCTHSIRLETILKEMLREAVLFDKENKWNSLEE